ncbi:MAG: hypothetical protein HY247_00095 [archaeon]|nr:MAG: hypothetical protein HY247_00095 [archaeon]
MPMSQPDCESLVSELLSAALLDIVPGPLTSREAQRFCLTDRGGAVLLRILEQTCEIPEASATVP